MNARRFSQAGGLLVTVLGTLVILSGFVAAALSITMQFSRQAERSRVLAQAVSIGDGSLQMLYADWQAQSRDYAPTNSFQPLPAYTPTAAVTPGAAEFPELQPYSAGANEWMIDPASYSVLPLILRGTSSHSNGPSPATSIYYFTAGVDLTARALSRPLQVRMRRTFEQHVDSCWRFQAFSDFDLELQPDGSPLTLDGDVHSNGTLYSGTDWLTVSGQASAAQGFVNGWAPDDSTNAARTITSPHFAAGSPFVNSRRDLFGVEPAAFDAADANANNDGYRELIERPAASGADPLAGRRLYEQAGVKVLIDAANGVTIMDQSGTIRSNPADPFFASVQSAIITGQSVQDGREAATVRVATLDVSKLTAAVESGALVFNGILYISDTSATPLAKRAVRLWRGARLPATGLTVATDNPLYVWGDYNTGGTYANATDTATTVQPDTNTDGSPADAANTVAAYIPAPAAIFSDATTILSNAWDDAAAGNSLSTRLAANTTVNTGIVTGGVATDAVNGYGQGLAGMLRFLENWKPADLGGGGAQRRFTNYGALLNWWRVEQADGAYSYGSYFTTPAQQLFYEKRFASAPPAPDLRILSFSKGRWYLE